MEMINKQQVLNLPRRKGYAANGWDEYIRVSDIEQLPTEGREEQKEPCWACGNLENGDTLYSMSDWDGGIGFDYIRDIQYCPVCGRKL